MARAIYIHPLHAPTTRVLLPKSSLSSRCETETLLLELKPTNYYSFVLRHAVPLRPTTHVHAVVHTVGFEVIVFHVSVGPSNAPLRPIGNEHGRVVRVLGALGTRDDSTHMKRHFATRHHLSEKLEGTYLPSGWRFWRGTGAIDGISELVNHTSSI